SDVALAQLEDGWAVGWVDERHQDPELYAVKVGENLLPTTPERRLTDTKGGAADLSIVSLGEQLLFAWGDTKNSQQRGYANVFVRPVSSQDLTPLGPELAVAKTPAHAHSIQASRFQQGAVLAWLESGNDQASPGVRWLKVDARGKPMGAIHSVDVQATSLS